MDISKLPVHEKTTIVAERYIIAVVDRISEDEAIISYINLKNRKEVLRILQKVNGAQILQFIDSNYWNVYSDSKLVENYDFSLFKDLDVKVKVSTKEKSLEIINFSKKEPPNKTTMFSGKITRREMRLSGGGSPGK